MSRNDRVVAYKIIKLSNRHHPTKQQYALVLTLESGKVVTKRLHDIYPTSRNNNINDESVELQNAANFKVLNFVQELASQGPDMFSKYKNTKMAMSAYIDKWNDTKKAKNVKYFGTKFIEYFEETPLSELSNEKAREWIEYLISHPYKYDTVRLMVMNASAMITWLDQHDMWHRKNPFTGLMKQYQNRFWVDEPVKSFLNDMDYEILFTTVADDKYRAARVFIQVASKTGLRPSEIMGCKRLGYAPINTDRIDHTELTWTFMVTKTSSRRFYRKIAIPRSLSVFLQNENIHGTLPFTESNIRFQFERLRKETGLEILQKTFRKDFAHRMEMAGASPDIINLHQGRGQHGVLFEHYLTDTNRAVRLCRQYIDMMFGEKSEIRLVK